MHLEKKEIYLLISGTLLALGGFGVDDPWIIFPCLGLSWIMFIGFCVIHDSGVKGRVVAAAVITLVLSAITERLYIHHFPGEKDPFTASLGYEAAYNYGEGAFWLIYEVPSAGTFASIVEVELQLRITNLQPIPSLVTSLSVETENTRGQWIKLVRMDPRLGRLGFVPRNEAAAGTVIVAQSLDAELERKPIGAGDTIQGLFFFEYASNPGARNTHPRYRVTIADSSGHKWAGVLRAALEGPDSLQNRPGFELDPKADFDFSNFRRRKRFTDPPQLR